MSVPVYAKVAGTDIRAKRAAIEPSSTAVFNRIGANVLSEHIRVQKPKSLHMNQRFMCYRSDEVAGGSNRCPYLLGLAIPFQNPD